MMKFLLGTVLSLSLLASSALADPIISIDTQTFTQNTGVQTLSIFASSPTSQAFNQLSLTFQMTGGTFSPTAGTFGQAGMIGTGNVAGTSTFNAFASPNNNFSTLNMIFNSTQALPTSASLLASFNIDTSAYAPGTYNIATLASSFAPASATTPVLSGGSFTIQAVPEPSSMALLSLGVMGVALRRKPRAGQPLAA